MADERLRELERRASEGSVDARAKWLAERVRIGELEQERLRIAAYCGDLGARMVSAGTWAWECEIITGGDAPRGLGRARTVTVDVLDLPAWLRGLGASKHVLDRATVLAAEHVLEVLVDPEQAPHRPSYIVVLAREQVSAARAWLDCPCPDHLGAWYRWTHLHHAPECQPWVPCPNMIETYKSTTRILAAGIEVGNESVREAVAAGLARWATG